MIRKDANMAIIIELLKYVHHNPDIRFGQALRNLGVVKDYLVDEPPVYEVRWANHFNEEPVDTLKRMDALKTEK